MTSHQSTLTLKTVVIAFPIFFNLSRWLRNYKTRQALAKLSLDQLNDIGVTPAQAAAEIEKPFWK